MELRQLQYFSHVAANGSFSRAAIVLGVAQPALSRQIRQLETELDVALFYRNGRGVSLTAAGEMLLTSVEGILRDLQKATTEVTALKGVLSGSAVIGLPPSVGRVLTVPLAQRMRNQHPKLLLRIVEGFSGHIVEWLACGRIDVGLIYDDPALHRMVLEPLVEEVLHLIGPADRLAEIGSEAVPAKRLADLPLILPSRPHGLRLYLDAQATQLGITLNVGLEVDALSSMLQAVRAGLGFTVLPPVSLLDAWPNLRLISWPIIEPEFRRVLTLATHSQRPMAASTNQLVRIVRDQVLELCTLGHWNPCQ